LLMDYVVKELEKKVMYCLKLHQWNDNKTTCKLICLSVANTLSTDMTACNVLKNAVCDKTEDDRLCNIYVFWTQNGQA
jgi:N-acetylglutamate synthase-like GNAT family acetyltransferase